MCSSGRHQERLRVQPPGPSSAPRAGGGGCRRSLAAHGATGSSSSSPRSRKPPAGIASRTHPALVMAKTSLRAFDRTCQDQIPQVNLHEELFRRSPFQHGEPLAVGVSEAGCFSCTRLSSHLQPSLAPLRLETNKNVIVALKNFKLISDFSRCLNPSKRQSHRHLVSQAAD